MTKYIWKSAEVGFTTQEMIRKMIVEAKQQDADETLDLLLKLFEYPPK